ncbi:hypothetical protein [Microbacterium sp. NPDC055357]
MSTKPDLQARRDRSDLWAAIIVAALAAVFVVRATSESITVMFSRPGAIIADTPVVASDVTLADGIPAVVSTAQVVTEGVSPVTATVLVTGIVLFSASLLAAIVLACLLCRNLLRAIVFSRTNTRLLFAISMVLLFGSLGGTWFRMMGLNGVFAALGSTFDQQFALFVEGAPTLIAVLAAGVLVIVFRRGDHMQRDAEGLV